MAMGHATPDPSCKVACVGAFAATLFRIVQFAPTTPDHTFQDRLPFYIANACMRTSSGAHNIATYTFSSSSSWSARQTARLYRLSKLFGWPELSRAVSTTPRIYGPYRIRS